MQSLLELINRHLAVEFLNCLALLVRRQWKSVNLVDDAVLGNAIVNGNIDEAIDSDEFEAPSSGDIDSNGGIIKESREILMALGLFVSLIENKVAVDSDIRHEVVLQNGSQVLVAFLGVEKERIRLDSERSEGLVGRRKHGSANHLLAMDKLDKVGLLVRKKKCREARGQEGQYHTDEWGRDEDVVDGMDDAVGCFLNN